LKWDIYSKKSPKAGLLAIPIGVNLRIDEGARKTTFQWKLSRFCLAAAQDNHTTQYETYHHALPVHN